MGEIFQFEIAGRFPGAMITVTKAYVTKDLSVARFYLSLFAVADKKNLLEEIRKHSQEIRYKLGLRIGRQMRVVPQLEFFEDDSLDYIDNIERLLND